MEIRNVSWNVKQLITMSNRGTLRFDYPIQRSGGQWKSLQQSYLIHSLAQNYPIPPVYLLGVKEEIMVIKRGEEVPETVTVRYILDGKQRITTIRDFVEDQYKLDEDTPGTTIDGQDFEIAGMLFSELDEEVQDMILSRTLLTYTVDGDEVSDEEIEDLFFRMNNGSALTTQQKAKALMGVEWATRLTELGEHVLITELSSFTKTQLRADGHLTAIIQTMMMLDDSFEYKNVSQKTISDYSNTFKSDSERKMKLYETVKNGMDYLVEVFDKKETLLLRKVHFPMTLLTALKAIENKVESEDFHNWSVEFKKAFKPKKNSVVTIPTNYADFTGAGSTGLVKANGRRDEMIRHMTEFVKGGF